MYNMAPKLPAMPASIVFTAIDPIRRLPFPDAPSVEPGLKPNQPKARMKQPVRTSTMSCPMIAFDFPCRVYLPIRGPQMIDSASALRPPTAWTTPDPAKSQYPFPSPKLPPRLASQPLPHAQLPNSGEMRAPTIDDETSKAAHLQRSD